jgi:aspartyl aminopeptidase
MQDSDYIAGLLEFIQHSPTPFHAVEQMLQRLELAGYQRLHEADVWQLENGGRYVVTRNDASIIAFTLADDPASSGFRMVGAHTDSPCLKVKPQPEMVHHSYYQLAVEVYGGALLNPWFDRDLSLAGRVSYLDAEGEIKNALLDFEQPIATIPSLAIHLDREANDSHSINKQKHLPPVLLRLPQAERNRNDAATKLVTPNFRDVLLKLLRKHAMQAQRVLDYELSFYDTQPPAVIGLHQDFIASARLDNLLSCYTALVSLLNASATGNCLLVCNDHEEVGSVSASGAHGPFLLSVLQRITTDAQTLARCIDRSLLVSADNAHGVHPNFSDKHDALHGPILNQGPVIKVNSNQRYATTGETSAIFRHLCEQADVPVQSFVVRADMACGSTIGPVTSSEIGVRTIDVGVPTFAMHSIRELAGRWDGYYLYRVLKEFYAQG